MTEYANYNLSVFVCRIHSTVISIVAKCSRSSKEKDIINKNIEKDTALRYAF